MTIALKELTVTADTHDVEVLTILASVRSRSCCNGVSKDGALHVGDCLRVRAVRCRVFLGVALKVDVETEAELFTVTECCTLVDRVRAILDVLVCEIANFFGSRSQIGKLLFVASWGSSFTGTLPKTVCGILVSRDGSVARYDTSTALVNKKL